MLGFYGPPLRPLPEGYVRDWFAFTTNILFSQTGQRLTVTIQLDGSAPFELCEVAAQGDQATQPAIMALLSIKDTTTGYSLLNDQAPVESFATTNVRSSPLNATHLFRSNASIQLDATNQGAATQKLFVTLKGFKWWAKANTPATNIGG